MTPNPTRIKWIQDALAQADLDGVIVSLPSNVLMVSGYWPVVGTAVAAMNADGRVAVICPDDERELATSGHASEFIAIHPGSLTYQRSAANSLDEPMNELLNRLSLRGSRLGIDSNAHVPAPYASMHIYGDVLRACIARCDHRSNVSIVDDRLEELRAVASPVELDKIRLTHRIAGAAFLAGATHLKPGLGESRAAVAFADGLSDPHGLADLDRSRAHGFAWCMSGPNSASACAAYARSRARILQAGDLVLVHSNSTLDGFWTDVTRTFCFAKPDARQQKMFDAVFAARAAALNVIRPGVPAAAVDKAARDELARRGFTTEFRHGTGHGVGFAAIDGNAQPRIHPASKDILVEGNVFNVEPSIYIDTYGGIRHCDVVAVTSTGVELLTDFQSDLAAVTK
jgi:Xaa-Pro aminopeptidase